MNPPQLPISVLDREQALSFVLWNAVDGARTGRFFGIFAMALICPSVDVRVQLLGDLVQGRVKCRSLTVAVQ
jgi:hypothetical protein